MKVDSDTLTLKPSDIRFTQDSICKTFSNGNPCRSLFDDIRNGATSITEIPKIRVAKNEQNGKYYSANNRRLYVFRALEHEGIISEIPVRKVKFENIDSGHDITTNNDGESVTVRGLDCGECLPHSIVDIKAMQRKRKQQQIREKQLEEEKTLQQKRIKQQQQQLRQQEKEEIKRREKVQEEWEEELRRQSQQHDEERKRKEICLNTFHDRENLIRNERRSERSNNWWKWIAGGCAVVGLMYCLSKDDCSESPRIPLPIARPENFWENCFGNIMISDI